MHFGFQHCCFLSVAALQTIKHAHNFSARFTLTGSYHYVGSSDPARKELKILLVSARIEDERGKEIALMERAVNDSDDIFQVPGLTGACPAKPSGGNSPTKPQVELMQNNQAAQEAQANPRFDVQDGTRVAAVGLPH